MRAARIAREATNFGRYKSTELDQLAEKAVFSHSREEALPIYKQIMALDAADVPYLSVAYHHYVEAVSPRVRAYRTLGLAHYDLRTLELA